MKSAIAEKLARAGFPIAVTPAPLASYLPFVVSGDLVAVSGVLPMESGQLIATGTVGDSVSEETAQKCAQQCALHLLALLARAEEETGRRVVRILRVTGFVASAPEFSNQHRVLNGASDFIVRVLGDEGRHSREAVGVQALPLNAPVEISAWAVLAPPSP
ncbi:MAG: RidA family protein [bacterium JZ-2024 1]